MAERQNGKVEFDFYLQLISCFSIDCRMKQFRDIGFKFGNLKTTIAVHPSFPSP